MDNIPGLSKKVLTSTLRKLERHGIVSRQVYPEIPVRVEYTLTPLGWQLTEPLMALYEWALAHESGSRAPPRDCSSPAPRVPSDPDPRTGIGRMSLLSPQISRKRRVVASSPPNERRGEVSSRQLRRQALKPVRLYLSLQVARGPVTA